MRTFRFLLGLIPAGLLFLSLGCQSQPDANLKQGYAAFDQKQYDQATAAADRYLKKNPTGNAAAEALYLRGRAIEQKAKAGSADTAAQLEHAKAHYLKALTLSPSATLESYLYTSLGNVSYWLDDYGAAESHWLNAYKRLDRDDLKAWILYRIGLCRQRLGNWANADAAFASVQRQYPGTEAATRAAAHQGARAFNVQVAAFKSTASADRLVSTLRSQKYPAFRQDKPNSLSLVLVGPCKTFAEANSYRSRLLPQYKDALITP